MINNSMFSSNDQTWETPQYLFDILNNVFHFTLDVCALPETAKCSNYFTPEIDGLAQPWYGNCWMNPPYGREQIKWIYKANYESLIHDSTIVCLIPARPDTKVWQDIIFKYSVAVCFIRGRLKFGGSKDSAPFPSALVVFGHRLNDEQRNILYNLGELYTNNSILKY